MRTFPALSLLLAAGVVACSESPAAVPPPRPVGPAVPPQPAVMIVTADFTAIFAAQGRSRSVYLPAREPDWGKRILLGPNLVFEASRTSLDDTPVTGPAGAEKPAPDQGDALGTPVDVALSTVMLGYLAGKGSAVLAPAVTRRWSPEWWCAKESCAGMTWVERVLLAQRARWGAGKDPPRIDVRPEELPTAVLAVRRFGFASISADVVVAQTSGTMAYRFRRSPEEASQCPPVTFEVPVLVFEAEVVSVRDGRILARLDEMRQVVMPAQPRVQIAAVVPVVNPEAVKELRGYAEAVEHGNWSAQAPTQPYWLQSEVRCKNGEETFRRLARQVEARADAEQEGPAAQLVAKAMDPLFEAVAEEAPKGGKARAKGAAKPR